MRVLGRLRLSRSTKESTSIERQREIIQQWADANDYTVVGWAEDLDVSGSLDAFETPELGKWLSDRAPEWDIVAAWKLDRLDQIGRSLARSIAKKVDAAFFGNTVSNGPSGLLSLSGVNVVDTGTVTLDSLDPFHEAKAAALADGADVSVWVLAPDVALALSKAKQLDEGSDVGLLDQNGVGDGVHLAAR
jgi:hypothetical protein